MSLEELEGEEHLAAAWPKPEHLSFSDTQAHASSHIQSEADHRFFVDLERGGLHIPVDHYLGGSVCPGIEAWAPVPFMSASCTSYCDSISRCSGDFRYCNLHTRIRK